MRKLGVWFCSTLDFAGAKHQSHSWPALAITFDNVVRSHMLYISFSTSPANIKIAPFLNAFCEIAIVEMSRFVSAGTDEEPSERDEAWLNAQEEIESKRREKAEAGKQEGGKTLYETLQANKGD